ncbi:hypothetical protein NN3_18370 [Nocardia neocaledoniensis NBRC 108232]|uniref:Uncharacterized protein n=1 Tax=Nocardia neocaledoniensis TaxID=236511 RepID=A0A317N569_9NOCA|nr:hypothetical protein [Nocardia neocaledoniensis]PWV70441.1 hypothetical protein DFR69_113155 [Nocardia neocaledoniensis]GEM30830.1 hypothetical protein NN3_18370 [Nocardia neocaledoniensis NBRC 108232]
MRGFFSDDLAVLFRRLRDDSVELLHRRLGRDLHDAYGDNSDQLRHAIRRFEGGEQRGEQQIVAAAGEAERSLRSPVNGREGHGLPEAIRRLLTSSRAAGADARTTTRVERAILDHYSEQRRVRESQLRREFLNNKSSELQERGDSADTAHASALSQAGEYLHGERAQQLITRDATARTAEWVDRIGLIPVLREVGTSPAGILSRHADDMLERFATQGAQVDQLPKGLKQAVDRIENSGADARTVADARALLHDRYHDYRRQPMVNTYRDTLLEQRAEFARRGFPSHVADRLAERQTEAFAQTAKAQRMIDGVAANNTNQWFNKMQTAAERDGVSIADRLADTHRYEQQPLSAAELRAASEKLTAMHQRLDATQERLTALLERSPELADKGADRWQAGIDTYRKIVTRFEDTVQNGTTGGDPITRRMINEAALQGPGAGIRGFEGEVTMAQKLDNIHNLGPLVDVRTPTGTPMASEVDIVTDGGRVWHEVKTNDPDSQRSFQKELEAQARRQLAISHMNTEYWVDGKPPQLKMHFMNGVNQTVKSRLEALRIEDENGHIVDSHRIEVFDES